jgi:peptidoglycan/LPS O-acetylase OafA/YrhL
MYLASRWRTLGGVHTGETWRLGHRPALDGLRGIAILLVLINHIDMPGGHHAGQAGVGAFFVLSGFLITSVLLEQRERGGRHLRRFYARRALRLGPALLTCIAITWSFAAFVHIPVGLSPWAALLYISDFVQAGGFQPGFYAHTWSLGVEEQFYLLWPLALTGLLTARRLNPVATLVAASAVLTGWTLWLSATGVPLSRIVYAPDTRAAGLIAGCALAVAFARSRMLGVPAPAYWFALVALPVLGFLPNYGLSDVAAIVLVVPVSVVLVWACVDGTRRTLLDARWLRAIGARSYGLYLWHLPLLGITFFAAPSASWWLRAVVALVITAGFVELSWRRLERPLLRLGRPSRRSGLRGLVCAVDADEVAVSPSERRARRNDARAAAGARNV